MIQFYEFESPAIKNTCVILSLCALTGYSWDKVIFTLRRKGVKCNLSEFEQGFTDREIKESLQALGVNFEYKKLDKPMTLNNFYKNNPEGEFMLCTHNHAFVLINGVVGDSSLRPKCRIVSYFQITG